MARERAKADYDIQVVKSARNLVGESPLWNPIEQAIYWVDTRKPCVQRLDSHGEYKVWPMPNRTTCIALHKPGSLMVGTQRGFCELNLATGEVTSIADPDAAQPNNRLNDGKIDKRGRYWCASADEEHSRGSIFRLDPDHSCHRMDGGFTLGNGLAFSPDNKTMIVGDTMAGRIYAYDFDLDEGRIGNRRVFASYEGEPWHMDGGTFDAEGYYWCAMIFGGALGRFDPNGKLDRKIFLPVSAPTMCNFGGPNMDTLYVTSSHLLLTDELRAREPEAGSLFAIHGLGVRGIAEPFFGVGSR